MATLDLSRASSGFDMTAANLVTFGSVLGTPTATSWSYLTPAGNRVTVTGTSMQFDASGRPTAGSVTAVSVDVANDGDADIGFTGLSEGAFPFGIAVSQSSPDAFWRMLLEANDVILGPEKAKGAPEFGSFYIVGDGGAARPGVSVGGRDIIQLGDAASAVDGDVENVGDPATTVTSTYTGGNDDIVGMVTVETHSIAGDASRVYGGSRLNGGNDSILNQSTDVSASVSGDADDVVGTVFGGNDFITAGKDFRGVIAGDVFEAHPGSLVDGGNDTINGGDLGETLIGDVYRLRGGQLVGGNDTINGGGGNDIIAGDAYVVRADSIVAGGDDLIRAGGGNDEVYGDAGYVGQGGSDRIYGDSGNDRLHGEGGADTIDGGTQNDTLYGGDGDDWLSGGADADRLYGDAGNDQLDGGSGADTLVGLSGDDTYYVNDAGDIVSELTNFGSDTVWSFLSSFTLSANVEALRFNGIGNFTGVGNDLANTIAGSAGADRLDGAAGNDLLIGGAGGDALIGGAGIDTASYETAAAGVDARLLAAPSNAGDAFGDSHDGIENLTGSDFGDTLIGSNEANTLSGRASNDILTGLLGNDLLLGGDGVDTLQGDGGNDTLRGGGQADLLVGDIGNDVFDFDSTAESTLAARDIIRAGTVAAFQGAGAGVGDLIDLAGIDANTTAGGNQAFVFGGNGIGRISAVASGADTLIRGNVDGDAAFEFALLIEDSGVLAGAYRAADFVL